MCLTMPWVRQVFMMRLATMCISAGISSLLMSPQLSRTRMSVMCGCSASGQRSTEVQAHMQHSRLRTRYVSVLFFILHPPFHLLLHRRHLLFSSVDGRGFRLSVLFPVFPGVFLVFPLFLLLGGLALPGIWRHVCRRLVESCVSAFRFNCSSRTFSALRRVFSCSEVSVSLSCMPRESATCLRSLSAAFFAKQVPCALAASASIVSVPPCRAGCPGG